MRRNYSQIGKANKCSARQCKEAEVYEARKKEAAQVGIEPTTSTAAPVALQERGKWDTF